MEKIKGLEPGVHHIPDVPLIAFNTLASKQEESTCRFRIAYYSSATTCMIITLPSAPHEYLHLRIAREVVDQAGGNEGDSYFGSPHFGAPMRPELLWPEKANPALSSPSNPILMMLLGTISSWNSATSFYARQARERVTSYWGGCFTES